MRSRPVGVVVGCLLVIVGTLTGCGSGAPARREPPQVVVQAPPQVGAPAAPPGSPACDPAASLRPSDADGPAIARIRERGYLTAGVDLNSYLWGSVDAVTGEIVGFDIDLVRAVARDILGPDAQVKFVTMAPEQRVPRIRAGDVDVMVRTMTITCERKAEVAFSTVYFRSGQQLVVAKGSPITAFDQRLRGRRVCVGAGTTAVDLLARADLGAIVDVADNHLDCLVRLQQGKTDAILTHGSLGAGLAAQDPMITVLEPRLDETLYGIAMNTRDTDLVRRVNRVLENYRAGGADSPWMVSYRTWLARNLSDSNATPPPAVYAD
ncbi:glutamate ABC transporter substrate-binding protein [Streptomyces sp. SID3343]|uniref:glutamate ABC transporter substrate-binding protein n=1 Tax=Streptomyces sp. SID3343 TaxID=2690260 RepID=UPI00136F3C45|nr:glutamate ABC transporter substrate-binding protein [Streptomyces sp. SID3343]MYW05354.1 transporter substrate-binding domain-containing protein [Streptomyces sp. SID3343]